MQFDDFFETSDANFDVINEADLKQLSKKEGFGILKDVVDAIMDEYRNTHHKEMEKKDGGDYVHLPILLNWVEKEGWKTDKDEDKIVELGNAYKEFMGFEPEARKNITLKNMPMKNFVSKVLELKAKQEGKAKPTKEWVVIKDDPLVKDALVYEDELFAVYWAKDHETTKKLVYGCQEDNDNDKGKYGLCIGFNSPTYFNNYLFERDMTTYIIYFKNDTAKLDKDSPGPFILIDAIKDGTYSFNPIWEKAGERYIINNDDTRFTTTDDLMKMYNDNRLKSLFEKKVFVWREPSDSSIEDMGKISNGVEGIVKYLEFKLIRDPDFNVSEYIEEAYNDPSRDIGEHEKSEIVFLLCETLLEKGKKVPKIFHEYLFAGKALDAVKMRDRESLPLVIKKVQDDILSGEIDDAMLSEMRTYSGLFLMNILDPKAENFEELRNKINEASLFVNIDYDPHDIMHHYIHDLIEARKTLTNETKEYLKDNIDPTTMSAIAGGIARNAHRINGPLKNEDTVEFIELLNSTPASARKLLRTLLPKIRGNKNWKNLGLEETLANAMKVQDDKEKIGSNYRRAILDIATGIIHLNDHVVPQEILNFLKETNFKDDHMLHNPVIQFYFLYLVYNGNRIPDWAKTIFPFNDQEGRQSLYDQCVSSEKVPPKELIPDLATLDIIEIDRLFRAYNSSNLNPPEKLINLAIAKNEKSASLRNRLSDYLKNSIKKNIPPSKFITIIEKLNVYSVKTLLESQLNNIKDTTYAKEFIYHCIKKIVNSADRQTNLREETYGIAAELCRIAKYKIPEILKSAIKKECESKGGIWEDLLRERISAIGKKVYDDPVLVDYLLSVDSRSRIYFLVHHSNYEKIASNTDWGSLAEKEDDYIYPQSLTNALKSDLSAEAGKAYAVGQVLYLQRRDSEKIFVPKELQGQEELVRYAKRFGEDSFEYFDLDKYMSPDPSKELEELDPPKEQNTDAPEEEDEFDKLFSAEPEKRDSKDKKLSRIAGKQMRPDDYKSQNRREGRPDKYSMVAEEESSLNEREESLETISDEDIQKVKDIEKKMYPPFMRMYHNFNSKEELMDFMEVDDPKNARIHIGDNSDWYLVLSLHPEDNSVEIVDMAGQLGTRLIHELKTIFDSYRGMKLYGDFRDKTSWRLMKLMEKRGAINITEHEEWHWSDELMHRVTFEINKDYVKEDTAASSFKKFFDKEVDTI